MGPHLYIGKTTPKLIIESMDETHSRRSYICDFSRGEKKSLMKKY